MRGSVSLMFAVVFRDDTLVRNINVLMACSSGVSAVPDFSAPLGRFKAQLRPVSSSSPFLRPVLADPDFTIGMPCSKICSLSSIIGKAAVRTKQKS